jgi:hypothetical protein
LAALVAVLGVEGKDEEAGIRQLKIRLPLFAQSGKEEKAMLDIWEGVNWTGG